MMIQKCVWSLLFISIAAAPEMHSMVDYGSYKIHTSYFKESSLLNKFYTEQTMLFKAITEVIPFLEKHLYKEVNEEVDIILYSKFMEVPDYFMVPDLVIEISDALTANNKPRARYVANLIFGIILAEIEQLLYDFKNAAKFYYYFLFDHNVRYRTLIGLNQAVQKADKCVKLPSVLKLKKLLTSIDSIVATMDYAVTKNFRSAGNVTTTRTQKPVEWLFIMASKSSVEKAKEYALKLKRPNVDMNSGKLRVDGLPIVGIYDYPSSGTATLTFGISASLEFTDFTITKMTDIGVKPFISARYKASQSLMSESLLKVMQSISPLFPRSLIDIGRRQGASVDVQITTGILCEHVFNGPVNVHEVFYVFIPEVTSDPIHFMTQILNYANTLAVVSSYAEIFTGEPRRKGCSGAMMGSTDFQFTDEVCVHFPPLFDRNNPADTLLPSCVSVYPNMTKIIVKKVDITPAQLSTPKSSILSKSAPHVFAVQESKSGSKRPPAAQRKKFISTTNFNSGAPRRKLAPVSVDGHLSRQQSLVLRSSGHPHNKGIPAQRMAARTFKAQNVISKIVTRKPRLEKKRKKLVANIKSVPRGSKQSLKLGNLNNFANDLLPTFDVKYTCGEMQIGIFSGPVRALDKDRLACMADLYHIS